MQSYTVWSFSFEYFILSFEFVVILVDSELDCKILLLFQQLIPAN